MAVRWRFAVATSFSSSEPESTRISSTAVTMACASFIILRAHRLMIYYLAHSTQSRPGSDCLNVEQKTSKRPQFFGCMMQLQRPALTPKKWPPEAKAPVRLVGFAIYLASRCPLPNILFSFHLRLATGAPAQRCINTRCEDAESWSLSKHAVCSSRPPADGWIGFDRTVRGIRHRHRGWGNGFWGREACFDLARARARLRCESSPIKVQAFQAAKGMSPSSSSISIIIGERTNERNGTEFKCSVLCRPQSSESSESEGAHQHLTPRQPPPHYAAQRHCIKSAASLAPASHHATPHRKKPPVRNAFPGWLR